MARNHRLTRTRAGRAESVTDDLTRLRADVRTLMEHAAGAGRDGAAALKSRVSDGAQAALDNARGRASRAAHAVEQQVEEHPYRALALAAGAGMVLGLLMRRR